MLQFIKDNELIFFPLTITITKGGKKLYPLEDLAGWNLRTHKKCIDEYKDKSNKHFLIKCNSKFLIFDTDTENDFNKLNDTLRYINKYNEKNITKSTRNNIYNYKNHFWFKVEDDEFKNMKKHKLGDMEVFIGNTCHIAELKESILNDLEILTYQDYIKIMNEFKISKNIENDFEIIEDPCLNKEGANKELLKILDNLNPNRWVEYNSWITIYMVFINEGFDLKIFKHYSKKHYEDYNEQNNNKVLKSIVMCKGFKIATLYHYLKEDNKKVFDEMQEGRLDFWGIFDDLKNHYDPANYYYSMKPKKYVRSNLTGWYEYNEFNILVSRGNCAYPLSMLNDITETLRSELIEQRNYKIPKDKNDRDYNDKMKIFKNAYHKVGIVSYIKSIIDYLVHLYTIDNIDDLIDSNINLFAFNNKLYDNTTQKFREIKPTDYISRTTKYNINEKSNPELRKEITDLIRNMFENDEIYNYHMQTIALSMFGNKNEAFYINSGNGRNGKGLCAQLIENSFGSYFYTGESTFLTTVYRADRPNPTLFNLKGVRYFLTTEPEADNETKFNIGLIKKITGNDTITTRDLGKSNISYKPQFTSFLQCNQKPKIDKIDQAVKNRFRIINFPYSFVQDPKGQYEKKIDISLKSKINQSWYNEFILLIIDISKTIDNIKIPAEVLGNVNEYLNVNNPVKIWLDESFILNDEKFNIATAMKSSELLTMYNNSGNSILSAQKFTEAMQANGIKRKVYNGYNYYYGLTFIEEK